MSPSNKPASRVQHYQYDALDRLESCASPAAGQVRRFYDKQHLRTEICDGLPLTVFRGSGHLLAQHDSGVPQLLAADWHDSPLASLSAARLAMHSCTAYGHYPTDNRLRQGFNGDPVEPLTGHYLLGKGYRAFSGVLMRFTRPDDLSPFAEGGLNSYSYCLGDPVNKVDHSGHFAVMLGRIIGGLFRGASKAVRPGPLKTSTHLRINIGIIGARPANLKLPRAMVTYKGNTYYKPQAQEHGEFLLSARRLNTYTRINTGKWQPSLVTKATRQAPSESSPQAGLYTTWEDLKNPNASEARNTTISFEERVRRHHYHEAPFEKSPNVNFKSPAEKSRRSRHYGRDLESIYSSE